MEPAQINKLRKANQIPFKVVNWLEQLTPLVVHDEFGVMYKGRIIAEDDYGMYAATVGVTDQTMARRVCSSALFRILKIEQGIYIFDNHKKG